MGLTDKIGIAILCAFVLFSVVRLFAAPLRLAAKGLLNTALGFLALFLLGLTEPVTGFSLGLNFFNALTVGILGVPGLVLLVLLRLGSVGLAGNGYTNPAFLLLASMAGWVLVRSAACLTAPLPRVSAVLGYLGRATMPIVILHFLSFKLVTWLGLLATGGESYLLAAFPVYFTGGVWWLAYTAAGLALPLAADAVYKKIKNAVLAH